MLTLKRAMILVFLICPACAAQPNPDEVTLKNAQVAFVFSRQTGGLKSMIDVKAGIDHIQASEGKAELWRLTFNDGKGSEFLSSVDAPCTSAAVTVLADGTQLAQLKWQALDRGDEPNAVDVAVEVKLPADSGIAQWHITVDNRSKRWGLYVVEFPRVAHFLKAGEYDIALPRSSWGKLFKACTEPIWANYPDGYSMPMQFMCASKGLSSVYMATHDKQAWVKRFVLTPGKDFAINTFAQDMGVAGSDHKDPFPVMFGVYQGNWIDGCKIYRKFALTAPWTSKGKLVDRADIPKQFKETCLWLRTENNGTAPKASPERRTKALLDARTYFGVPLGVHAYFWHHNEMDRDLPNFFPPRAGFVQHVRTLVSRGFTMMPYINGRVASLSIPEIKDYLPYSCKNEAGKPYEEFYGAPTYVMCPYTGFWQNKISELCGKLVTEVGANAIYVDQAEAGSGLCFDRTHGHPLGGGGWWVEGYCKMFARIHAENAKRGKVIPLTGEWAAEPYMDGIDGFLIWLEREEDEIPMFPMVYSGYCINFGSNSVFSFDDRSWVMREGRDFLWGCQNGWMTVDELFAPAQAKKLAFLKRVGLSHSKALKFLIYGELVDLIAHAEMLSGTWQSPDRTQPAKVKLPCIQGSVWRSQENTIGVLLVNYQEEKKSIQFSIDFQKYGLPRAAKYTVRNLASNTATVQTAGSDGILKFDKELGPWEISVVEISPIK